MCTTKTKSLLCSVSSCDGVSQVLAFIAVSSDNLPSAGFMDGLVSVICPLSHGAVYDFTDHATRGLW